MTFSGGNILLLHLKRYFSFKSNGQNASNYTSQKLMSLRFAALLSGNTKSTHQNVCFVAATRQWQAVTRDVSVNIQAS